MEKVRFLVRFAGEWEKKDQTYTYKGGIVKGIMVSTNICYSEMVDKIHDLTKIDRKTHSLKMKAKYNVHELTDPVEIEGPNDLEYFISCNADKSIPGTSLCISSVPRENVCDDDFDFDSDMGENGYDLREDGYELGEVGGDLNSPTTEDTNASNLGDSYCSVDVKEECAIMSKNGYDAPLPFVTTCQPHNVSMSKSLVETPQASSSVNANCMLKVGDLFLEKRTLYKKLCLYAVKKHFQFKVVKSTKNLFVVACLVNGCKWWLRATKLKDSCFFVIKKFRDVHQSSGCFEFCNHRQATGWIIGECIKPKYEGVGIIYRPKDILNDFQRDQGVCISYGKAWRARESALSSLYGSPEESFAQLPHFFAQLEAKNPGSITYIGKDSNNHFEYLFMALGASLRGFHSSIRPVICVDGTHLKGKYLGTLFIATALDGNNQVFPLAFGVGPSESDVAWECFLSKLHDALGDIQSLVIVSDRHKSIAKGVAKVFADAVHVACIYHLSQNLAAKKFNADVIPLFYIAAKAYRIVDFNRMMEQIRIFDNGRVYSYLLEVGFDFWSRAHCRGDRYDVMTTNIAECLNGVLRDARSLPITMLMEHIRAKLQRWFHDRRTEALAMTNIYSEY